VRIGDVAFVDMSIKRGMNITSVVIPASVKEIGEQAFADCENLTS
jgi:hypothetical protein